MSSVFRSGDVVDVVKLRLAPSYTSRVSGVKGVRGHQFVRKDGQEGRRVERRTHEDGGWAGRWSGVEKQVFPQECLLS